ncbi:hypothetical protein ACFX2G_038583 [Malus domestica]
MKSSVFLNRYFLNIWGRSLLSIFIHNRLHNNDQMSQGIRLDPLYLLKREQPTFFPTKRTKQPTSFMVLSREAQPILAFPSFFSLIPAGKKLACLTFQQPTRPATTSFLTIVSLARVRFNSPKDMSHVAHLALCLSTLIRAPAAQATLGFSQAEQPK